MGNADGKSIATTADEIGSLKQQFSKNAHAMNNESASKIDTATDNNSSMDDFDQLSFYTPNDGGDESEDGESNESYWKSFLKRRSKPSFRTPTGSTASSGIYSSCRGREAQATLLSARRFSADTDSIAAAACAFSNEDGCGHSKFVDGDEKGRQQKNTHCGRTKASTQNMKVSLFHVTSDEQQQKQNDEFVAPGFLATTKLTSTTASYNRRNSNKNTTYSSADKATVLAQNNAATLQQQIHSPDITNSSRILSNLNNCATTRTAERSNSVAGKRTEEFNNRETNQGSQRKNCTTMVANSAVATAVTVDQHNCSRTADECASERGKLSARPATELVASSTENRLISINNQHNYSSSCLPPQQQRHQNSESESFQQHARPNQLTTSTKLSSRIVQRKIRQEQQTKRDEFEFDVDEKCCCPLLETATATAETETITTLLTSTCDTQLQTLSVSEGELQSRLLQSSVSCCISPSISSCSCFTVVSCSTSSTPETTYHQNHLRGRLQSKQQKRQYARRATYVGYTSDEFESLLALQQATAVSSTAPAASQDSSSCLPLNANSRRQLDSIDNELIDLSICDQLPSANVTAAPVKSHDGKLLIQNSCDEYEEVSVFTPSDNSLRINKASNEDYNYNCYSSPSTCNSPDADCYSRCCYEALPTITANSETEVCNCNELRHWYRSCQKRFPNQLRRRSISAPPLLLSLQRSNLSITATAGLIIDSVTNTGYQLNSATRSNRRIRRRNSSIGNLSRQFLKFLTSFQSTAYDEMADSSHNASSFLMPNHGSHISAPVPFLSCSSSSGESSAARLGIDSAGGGGHRLKPPTAASILTGGDGFVFTTLRAKTTQPPKPLTGTVSSGQFGTGSGSRPVYSAMSPSSSTALGMGNSPMDLLKAYGANPTVIMSSPTTTEGGGLRRQPSFRPTYQHQGALVRASKTSGPIQVQKNNCEAHPDLERLETKEIFTGQELIDWLSSEILPERHYLRRLLAKQDFQLLLVELCSRLLLIGVLACHDSSTFYRFKPEFNYSWAVKPNRQDFKALNGGAPEKSKLARKLSFLEPTPQPPINDYTALKYSEQDFQAVLMGIKREHKEALDDLQSDHQTELQMLNDRHNCRLQECENRIKQLRKKLEAYESCLNLSNGVVCFDQENQDQLNQLRSTDQLLINSIDIGILGSKKPVLCSSCIKCQKGFFENYIEASTQTDVHPGLRGLQYSHSSFLEQQRRPPTSDAVSQTLIPLPPTNSSSQTDPFMSDDTASTSSLLRASSVPSFQGPPSFVTDDSNSDCRSSISVDSAFCDDSCPGSSSLIDNISELSPSSPITTSFAPPPPAPPPPPLPKGRKGLFSALTASHDNEKSAPRKQPVKPKLPMKPLHWKRIQLSRFKGPTSSRVLWTELEEVPLDEDEFSDLFSRANVPSTTVHSTVNSKRMSIGGKRETMKILDEKRSKALGILIQSQHLDISDIATAIFNCDTSLISVEIMQALYEQRPQPEELQSIKSHIDSGSIVPLDRQEQFLWELSQIPQLEDRILAIILQATMPEKLAEIEQRLNTVTAACKSLRQNKSLHWVLGFLLTVGNYMNGENYDRGQADGFGLEILPKLKDVKAKDNATSILNYMCRMYIKKFYNDSHVLKANSSAPIGESSDFLDASMVSFSDLEKDLAQISRDLENCCRRVSVVLELSDEVHRCPFSEIMDESLKKVEQMLQTLRRTLLTTKAEFDSTLQYFHWFPPATSMNISKSSADTAAAVSATKDFFSIWAVFAADLKTVWRKERDRHVRSKMETNKCATLPPGFSCKRSRTVANYMTLSSGFPPRKNSASSISRDLFSSAVARIMEDQDTFLPNT